MQIIAFGDRFSAAYTSIMPAISQLGTITFRTENSFRNVDDAVDFVRNSNLEVALFPNPYGNKRRQYIYLKLKALGFPTIVFDRGSLPNSWFFDTGFNFDSDSYHPINWDKPLSSDAKENVAQYIDDVKKAPALETQGPEFDMDAFKAANGILDKKILFVAFQRPSDTTIKHFSGRIGGYESFCKLVSDTSHLLKKSESDWMVIGKKHPLETDRPVRDIDYFADDAHINSILSGSDAVLTVNSGVGVLAQLFDKRVLFAGDAFYGHNKLNVAVRSVADIIYQLDQTNDICAETRDRFINHLTTRVYSFGDFETREIIAADGSRRTITDHIEFDVLRFPKMRHVKKKEFS